MAAWGRGNVNEGIIMQTRLRPVGAVRPKMRAGKGFAEACKGFAEGPGREPNNVNEGMKTGAPYPHGTSQPPAALHVLIPSFTFMADLPPSRCPPLALYPRRSPARPRGHPQGLWISPVQIVGKKARAKRGCREKRPTRFGKALPDRARRKTCLPSLTTPPLTPCARRRAHGQPRARARSRTRGPAVTLDPCSTSSATC